MLQIQNGADIAVIVLHEIYGINAHMELVCNTLSGYGVDVWCPELLNRGEAFAYSEESDAYTYFMQEVGFPAAAASVRQLIAEISSSYRRIVLVGFSVGATVAWLLSEDAAVRGIVGFYGSRIRNYMDTITPACEVLLFFPREEGSFNVDELLAALRGKPHVEVHKLAGQHGFSDPFSSKYNEASAQEALQRVRHFLVQGSLQA